ncbi:MAG: vWA domain-containing protein [Myxococcales bacterium]
MRPASLSLCLALVLACQSYQFEEVQPRFLSSRSQSYVIPSEKKPPHLMLVVDRSGSMTEAVDVSSNGCSQSGAYDETSTESCKWNDLKRLMTGDQGFLATNASIVNFGLILFAGDDVCGEGTVASYLGEDSEAVQNAKKIGDLLEANKPKGGTPTALSLNHVFDDVRMRTAEKGRDRIVMLLTDGAPNCNPANASLCRSECRAQSVPASCFGPGECRPTFPCAREFPGAGCLDEDGTVAAVRKLADHGIRTFVIGFGAATGDKDSDAYRVLDAAAQAGGLPRAQEPRFYQADSKDQLSKALAELIDVVRRCDYVIPPPPQDLRQLEVTFVYAKGEVALRPPTAGDAGQPEWTWNPVTSKVTIQGARCEEIQSGSQGLTVVFRLIDGL